MLVWKIQTLNINVASLRYRCLFPLRYLARCGITSEIYGGKDTVKLTPQTRAIVFVKSFHHVDVATCDRAYQQGIPIVLDLCDNIFIDGYGADSDHIPAQNFRIMARKAAAIVTTGTAMKAEVEALLLADGDELDENTCQPLVTIIPDGSESIADIKFAFRSTRRKRQRSLTVRPFKLARRVYKQGRRRLKAAVYGVKSRVGRVFRRYGLLKPLPAQSKSSVTENIAGKGEQSDKNQAAKNQAAKNQTAKNQTTASQPIKQSRKKNQNESAPLWPKPWPAAPELKTVLWFGNHGAKYGNFGMLNILEAADALERVSQSCPLRLMVVSNNREKYETHIAPLPFETVYLPWHPRKIYDYIQSSDVVIIPNSQSRYSICKSANRAVLALSQGTPVIASRTPALDRLSGCVWFDDWAGGLREYLTHPATAEAHIKQAQQVIKSSLSGEAIAQQWIDLLEQIAPSAGYGTPRAKADLTEQPAGASPAAERTSA